MSYSKNNNKARKGFLVIVLVIAGLLLIYNQVLRSWFALTQCINQGDTWSYELNACNVAPPAEKVIMPQDFIGVTLSIPDQDTTVTIGGLTRGSVQVPVGSWGSADSFEKGVLMIALDKAVYAQDVVIVPVAVSFGGSGVFVYMTTFNINNGVPQHSGIYHVLGDRVSIDTITADADGDAIMVNASYFTHGAEQSLAEQPEVLTQSRYLLKEGILMVM